MPIRRLPNGLRHTHPQAGRDRPEPVVAILRNEWSRSSGMGGRDPPEWVVAINRTKWSRSSGMGGRDRPECAVIGIAYCACRS